jgi:16S rRNA (guanine527-N7)-methyltransferase
VSDSVFHSLLSARAARVSVSMTVESRELLARYFQMLALWNRRINLTALTLDPPTAETIDRLLIEPLVAAGWVETPSSWCDVGSGGGSPAIPFKIVHSHAELTMVESKSRKAAFLREAARTLGLARTNVVCARIEDAVASRFRSSDLVTLRGVNPDKPMWVALGNLLAESGKLFWFHSRRSAPALPAGFVRIASRDLGTASDAVLSICTPVFHVEQQ